jgi:protocatechuate 3,4-dioxygenase beta subunit
VVDAQSGTPIPSGWVMASRRGGGPETFGARIQPDGTYKIHRLEPGTYFLRMTATGYAMAPYRPNSDGQASAAMGGMGGAPVTVTAGNGTTGIDFKASRHGTILGRVMDERGQPMPQVQVRAGSRMEINGNVQMVPRMMGMTDERGEYRLSNLEPGEYEVSVEAGVAMRSGNVIDRTDPVRDIPLPTYVPTYYPGVTDRAQATPVRVASGEEKFGIDFQLSPSGGFSLSGVILTTDGKPCLQCMLMITRRSNEDSSFMMPMMYTGVNQKDGTFVRTGVSDGSYLITGGSSAPNGDGFLYEEIVVSGADIKDLRFRLRPGLTVSGSLRLEGKPANPEADGPPQSYVFLQPKNNESLVSFRGMGVSRRSQSHATPDAKGQFRFEEVPPLSFHIRARLVAGYYLSQVLHGAQDISTIGLDLTQASGEVTLRLIAKADAGTVQGKVVGEDGNALAGAQVRLLPVGTHEEREDFNRMAVADQSGAFTLQTVAPGDYVLFALVSTGTPLDARSPEMQQLKQRAQRLTVKPNSTQQVDAKVVKLEAPR